jgi:hypothetical protein
MWDVMEQASIKLCQGDYLGLELRLTWKRPRKAIILLGETRKAKYRGDRTWILSLMVL